jgi:hypothetical protein
MLLAELIFSLPAPPSIRALKSTHGVNGAQPRDAPIVGESVNLYLSHTSTVRSAMHHMSPHVTITSHIASFATKIAATAIALQSAHIVINAVTGQTYEHAQLIWGPNTDQWLYSTANEFGRLTKGVAPHMPSGSETMRYLFHHQLPPGR